MQITGATLFKHESQTSVGIAEIQTSPDTERFVVVVQRIDDLVDDGGEILAEKISAVVINFDLKDEALMVNNVPVPLNVTSVQVLQAEIVPANITQEQLKEYESSFDIGMVTVEVNTIANSYPTDNPNISLRRIIIAIRIIEIDGVTVVQNDVIEKILEAKFINSAGSAADSQTSDSITGSPTMDTPCNLSTIFAKIRHWWCCASKITRVANLGLRQPYQAVSDHHDDDDAKVEQVIFIADEEKRMLMEKHGKEEDPPNPNPTSIIHNKDPAAKGITRLSSNPPTSINSLTPLIIPVTKHNAGNDSTLLPGIQFSTSILWYCNPPPQNNNAAIDPTVMAPNVPAKDLPLLNLYV
ncbi:15983_t:CDS:2 [Racocetra fulgida]|uniref:15983_t:CDS:1 n=1 Tax=Racocetra fulgida TaxID=60492 RepID=A0A9N8VZJ8_9GLOM|nr:15983_t:CDS:2 [Racocetra fulgida]